MWDGKAFQPRLMLPLSLSYDHRVIDGASAARFNAYLGQVLADFRRVSSTMTTVVAVRKGGQVRDGGGLAGDLRRHAAVAPLEANQQALHGRRRGRAKHLCRGRRGGALPGAAAGAGGAAGGGLRFGSKDEVFHTFTLLHPVLKETFFLQTKEDEHDPYESSQFTC